MEWGKTLFLSFIFLFRRYEYNYQKVSKTIVLILWTKYLPHFSLLLRVFKHFIWFINQIFSTLTIHPRCFAWETMFRNFHVHCFNVFFSLLQKNAFLFSTIFFLFVCLEINRKTSDCKCNDINLFFSIYLLNTCSRSMNFFKHFSCDTIRILLELA